MNIEKFVNRKKLAISPVLATVILIAITLVAAVAIAGFVFGLFGTFTTSATIQASAVTCSDDGIDTFTCNINLTNTGSANGVVLTGATLKYADSGLGAVTLSEDTTNAPRTVLAGGTNTLTVTFVYSGGGAVSGSAFSGSLTTSNGGAPLFSGSFP